MPNKLISENAFNGVPLEHQHVILGTLAVDPSVPQETREAARAELDTLAPSKEGARLLARALEKIPKGFTLIELMIVVAIIAILVAIALPTYQVYTVRARLSEGMSLAGPAKIAVVETMQNTGAFPNSNAEAGFPGATTRYVASVNVGPAGVVTITYSNDTALQNARGKVIDLTPNGFGPVTWSCSSPANNLLTPELLPPNCR